MRRAFWLLLLPGAIALLGACAPPAGDEVPPTNSPEAPAGQASATPSSEISAEASAFLQRMSQSSEFSTDFSIHSQDVEDILSGGPPKDGIPAIDDPRYVSIDEADGWLEEQEPVIQVEVGGEARAYPIQILMWHEIVNDELNGLPLAVTFCPLCNTAIVFERQVDGSVLDFGTTGRLRYSNLIMYDRQTESWWQQANGEAIIGEYTGQKLDFYPGLIVAWEDFKQSFPQASVLSRETGHARPYGENPYTGYDDINSSPFLLRGADTPDDLPPMARVLTIDAGEEAIAFPYETLADIGLANTQIGGQSVLVLWQPGVASPLDTNFTGVGRDVGTAAAYSRRLDGQTLDFIYDDGLIFDEQTGSQWDVFGRAVDGELTGSRLEPVVAINHFWFSWAAFRPDTEIYQP